MFKCLLSILGFFAGMGAVQAGEWVSESLHPCWRQSFLADELLLEEKSELQHLQFFHNKTFGKVLVLDGIIQTTEADEYIYHEMMVHVPLLAHGEARKVLVIGGGDGGALREVLRHKSVQKAVLVEIDASVINFSKQYLPNHSQGAFDDPRAEVIIGDGCVFVKNCSDQFDVIICDSSDPVGPGAVLFTSEFYGDCHRLLSQGGIFVNQNGVPFLQPEEYKDTFHKRKEHFKDVSYYLAAIPTYAGGFMAFGWASDDPAKREVSESVLEERLKQVEGDLKYYTPAVHKASYALPKFLSN